MIKLLAKANDSVLSHCRCPTPLASLPSQMDCPWCGCGWLICCLECHRAFTYAQVIEVDTDYEAFIGQNYRRGQRVGNVSSELIDSASSWLKGELESIPVGTTVVYLDGRYFVLDAEPRAFEGIYAAHAFRHLPHYVALKEPAHLDRTLGQRWYWSERALLEPTNAN